MVASTCAELLDTLPGAGRSAGQHSSPRLPAEWRCLAALAAPTLPAAPDVPPLPRPQLQIRCFSGRAPHVALAQGVGYVATPTGQAVPAQGPLSTPNFVRVGFRAPLPAPVLVLNPEIWLFTYQKRRRATAASLLHLAGWGHPSHVEQRHQSSAGWRGSGAATEFFGPAVQQSLTQPRPYADIVMDSNHWFQRQGGNCLRPHGKRGRVQRFRFALATDAPAGLPTASGKRVGPLSDEVWLSVSPPLTLACGFHAPVYNHLYLG